MFETPNTDYQPQLAAALEEAVVLSTSILTRCVEENQAYFHANLALLEKVNERISKGAELASVGNYRVANIVQRHAIDLILQENHQLFKRSASLRKDLLGFRDHQLNVLNPLLDS